MMQDENDPGSFARVDRNFKANLFGGLSGRYALPSQTSSLDLPLVIAVHGGTYSSAYFDVPGYSLLDRAAALGIPLIALDRPGYGESKLLAFDQMTLAGQARFLGRALKDAWDRFGGSTRGIVLIGHSIGGAIATLIAAEKLDFPLLGLAISGVGLRTANARMPKPAPDAPAMNPPAAIKDQMMFGPDGVYADMPGASHVANTSCPPVESYEIEAVWPDDVHQVASAITVPVHYRQAEFDTLWPVNEDAVGGFAAAFTASPHVDAAIIRGTGHCIDFHRVGAGFQTQQLGFALQCASSR
jgi:pimeloyl-ACP methyl ester carboxylesterase